MKVSVSGGTIKVDIHGMRVEQARFRLESTIESCNESINEIIVIHGYKGGQKLKEMVKDLQSPRIASISPSFSNEGQTSITLRRSKKGR